MGGGGGRGLPRHMLFRHKTPLAVRRPWDGEESWGYQGNQGAMEEP